jgi:carbonic anhydrase/acetyltransferase-like protein (isoleucine patch superfamily)
VHGCVIEENVLIGMGAIVMDKAHIGSNSIIAAGSVVLENTIVEPGSLYAGVPAKRIKSIDPSLLEGEINRIANNYLMYSRWFSHLPK